uniref:Uncharacterized protein n=1 Tax=Panagrolaimus sp. JU765 TaxID=591449 RepID=A0AC34RFG8_9BILA
MRLRKRKAKNGGRTPLIESQSPKPERHPKFVHVDHDGYAYPHMAHNPQRQTYFRTLLLGVGFLILAGIFTGIMCLLHYTFNWVWVLALISMLVLFIAMIVCCVRI